MRKILITGGAGFIGSHIVEKAWVLNYDITVIDNLHTGHLDNIAPYLDAKNVHFIQADIARKEAIIEAFKKVDVVLHLAAKTSVPESIHSPQRYFDTNTLGTLNILECCREHHVPDVVLSSSAAIYGDIPLLPKQEAHVPSPQSTYAISKLDGEYLLALYQKQYGIHAVSLRYFNVFGPRQNSASPYAAVIPRLIDRALRGQDMVIYGDGTQTRDFIFVEDVALANLRACEQGDGVINIASAQPISINELARKIITITGSQSQIHYQPERLGEIKHSYADNTKMSTELKLCPQMDLMQGLEKTIAFFARSIRQ